MKITKKTVMVITFIGILIAGNAFGDDSSEEDRGRGHRGAPPEAYAACEGKEAGDTAEFVSPHGDTVNTLYSRLNPAEVQEVVSGMIATPARWAASSIPSIRASSPSSNRPPRSTRRPRTPRHRPAPAAVAVPPPGIGRCAPRCAPRPARGLRDRR